MGKFLPTKDYHVFEITGLSAKDIKQSVKKCKKDRKTFKQTTALNFIAKQFGIKKGFADYNAWYEDNLEPFMVKNGLLQHKDLVNNPHNQGMQLFTHKQIADRLYFSEKEIPKKIFTGYASTSHFLMEEISAQIANLPKEAIFWSNLIEGRVEFTKVHGELIICWRNLIGDVFVENTDSVIDEYVPCTDTCCIALGSNEDYNLDPVKIKDILRNYKDDWVEVIPFNDLYFLKASNGDYDFVFRNLKDKAFETGDTFFAPYLKHSDVPSSFNESYDFERWFYFGHKSNSDNLKKIKIIELWEERDIELAKNKYLDATNVLKEYYTDNKTYWYKNNVNKEKPDFFETVQISKQEKLHVSDVITIRELEEFLNYNPEYANNRHTDLDKLLPLNSEQDKSLPATATWYDAVVYCKWIEKKFDVPARLLTLEEYQSIHPYPNGCFENENYRKLFKRYEEDYQSEVRINNNGVFLNDVRFTEVSQLNSPDYRSDFDDLTFSYVKRPTYSQSKDNLSFCISPNFGEWLFDHYKGVASVILPYFMQSLYGDNNFYFDPKSSGKYKYRKIGFRVCYTEKKDAE